jgi:hypothetical protein
MPTSDVARETFGAWVLKKDEGATRCPQAAPVPMGYARELGRGQLDLKLALTNGLLKRVRAGQMNSISKHYRLTDLRGCAPLLGTFRNYTESVLLTLRVNVMDTHAALM